MSMSASSPGSSTDRSSRASATLIPFPNRRASDPAPDRSRQEQKRLLDAVFATGALEIAAGDVRLKGLAARLQILGFVAIDEIGEGGRARRLRPSEAIEAEAHHPWRLARSDSALSRIGTLTA
jgi:hypothetical protein